MNVTEGFELPSRTPDATDAKTVAEVWRLRLFCGCRAGSLFYRRRGRDENGWARNEQRVCNPNQFRCSESSLGCWWVPARASSCGQCFGVCSSSSFGPCLWPQSLEPWPKSRSSPFASSLRLPGSSQAGSTEVSTVSELVLCQPRPRSWAVGCWASQLFKDCWSGAQPVIGVISLRILHL